MRRIGIYSGTFNPVHSGHISFALQALTQAGLDKVYLMPERHHRQKTDVVHYAHRVAMLRQAIKPHPGLALLETADISFSVDRTLPRLKRQFATDELVFLMGSDLLGGLAGWPGVDKLIGGFELVIGVRDGDQTKLPQLIGQLPFKPKRLQLINSYASGVSSTKIREALRSRSETKGVLTSVERYSNRNWLYISLA